MTTLKSLEIWTAQAVCDSAIAFSVIGFLMHVARSYFERIRARMTIRMAADVSWLIYVALRDGALFVSAVAGLWVLNLDLMADIKIGLPFVPFATVVTCATLLWKMFDRGDNPHRTHRASVALSAVAAALNTIGYVLVMEGPGDEYRVAMTPFWRTMASLRSNANPELATVTFYISGVLLLMLAVGAVVGSMRTSIRS